MILHKHGVQGWESALHERRCYEAKLDVNKMRRTQSPAAINVTLNHNNVSSSNVQVSRSFCNGAKRATNQLARQRASAED